MNIRKLRGCVGGLETLFILESEDVCTSASAPIKNFEAALRKGIKKKKKKVQTNGTCNFKVTLPYRACGYLGETEWMAHLNLKYRSRLDWE